MKKIMLMFMFVMFLGVVSAFEFDNVQDYDKEKREYLITNALGIPFFGEDIARVKLTSNPIEILSLGYQKVAEFNVENYDDYNNVFNDMEFFNLKDNNKVLTRNFDYKYKTIVQVPNYENVCNDFLSVNGTLHQDCNLIEKGTKDKIVWEEINKATGLLKGNITIGIFTNVQRGDKVEWIPTLFGERLDEWAIWEDGGLKVGLVSYYRLNETYSNNTVVDALENNTAVNNGGSRGVSGIIGNAFEYNGTRANMTNVTTNFGFHVISNTINLWINPTNLSQGGAFVKVGSRTSTDGMVIGIGNTTMDNDGDNLIGLYDGIGWFDTDVALSLGWNMVTMVINGTGDINFYINGSSVANSTGLSANAPSNTAFIGGYEQSNRFFNGIIDEVGFWNRSLTGAEIVELFGDGLGCTYEDEICGGAPSITLNSPANVFNTTNQTVNFNGTVVDDNGIINVTLIIDGVNNETNSSAINNTNYLFTKNLAFGNHNWSYESCNNIDGCRTATTRNLTISSFIENSRTFNSSSFETAQESFTMNITTDGSTPTSAELIYDGTTYSSATITSIGGNYFNISRAITIPLVNETKSFFFNVTVNGIESSSSTQNQIINATNFTYCGASPLDVPYLNFTFKDEGDDSILNASNDLTDTTFWLGDGTVTKSYITSTSIDNFNYTFCSNPSDRTINLDMVFKYSKDGYPLRTFAFDDQTLTNSTTEQTLYLLATADGIYSSISIIETSGNTISGVQVIIERQFSGIWTTVGLDNSGSDGVVTFWVNPNFQHRITATKTGYVANQVTITPSQSLYTLTLQKTTGAAAYTSPLDGIKWVVNPASGTIAPGSRSFNSTVTSSESNLENCKFELVNVSNISQTFSSITAFTNSSYCFLDITYTATVNNNLFGRLSLDTTNTTGFVIVNADWKWILIDITDVKAWRSITSFFSDLKTLGEFGEGNEGEFSRIVVFFIFMTLGLGVLIYFTGIELSSPGITITIIWVLVLLASVGGFLTFESGSSNVNERIEQYGFFFILTLYVLNYFLTIIRRANE